MKSNNQNSETKALLKNQLLDITLISVLILYGPCIVFLISNNSVFDIKIIYVIHFIACLYYFLIVIFSRLLSFKFRMFTVVFVWCVICITSLLDYLYTYSFRIEMILGGIVFAGFLIFALKKMQRTYHLAINTLEKQHQAISISRLHQKETETQHVDLFNNMLDALIILELILDSSNTPKDYRFILVNPAFESMTGLKKEELIGKTVREVLPQTEQYWVDTYIQVALNGDTIRFEHYTKDLDSYFEVCAYCPKPGQVACIFQNITRRKKAEFEQQELENQLRQSHKLEALGTLAGGVAHDFNNLLMPIMGYTEMLLDDFSNNPDVKANLNEILKAASRAKNLAEQILTFSRSSKMQYEPVDVESVIDETIPLLRTTIPNTIEIKKDIERKGRKVIGDPSQFQQIIMNLCTNAYQAIDKNNGLISISLRKRYVNEFFQWNAQHLPSGHYLVLSIADNGQGIDLETQERIFDPYFTTKAKGKGTGLGLSMVLGIVNRFNGGISLKSTIGKGTCFDIFMPVRQEEKDSKEMNNNMPIAKRSERILLVDDEEAILNIEKKMLQRMGYSVNTCMNSLDARALFEQSPDSFDLIISDLTMPQMAGDRLAYELTQIRPDIPVIICTRYSEQESELSTKPGVSATLIKPILKNELAHAIRQVINGK